MADAKKPQVKVEEKKLTDAQKYRLLNVHLNDRIIQLERELAGTIQQVGAMKEEIVNLKKQIHEADANVFFKELGIKRGEALQLNDDGTLLITRQIPVKPAKLEKDDEKKPEEAKKNGNGEPAPEKETAEAGSA